MPANPIGRRDLLKGAALAPALPAQAAPGKPNVVFFMVDQLSAKWIEDPCRKVCPTPNLDKLRARSVSFSSAISSNPICCPTRATLATGLSTRGHGVLQNGYELDPAIPTFMRLLQQAGWRTGAFGKVHHHVHFHGVHPDYRPYGYDVVFNTEDARGGAWLDWVEKEHPRHYESALATIWPTEIPEFKAYGPGRVDLSSRIKKIRAAFQWATREFPQNTAGTYTLPYPEEVSQTDWITGNALDFIRRTDRAQPLLAHISYVQPHSPFCPPGAYMKEVDESQIPAPIEPEWLDDPIAPRCFAATEGARKVIPPNWRGYRHYYFADLVHLDRQLGLVTKALEESGRLDNTYLIFLSDHGELFMDHGFSGKGERHYDACVRVPLMIAGPGLRRGESRAEIAQLEDIFPTVMEMASLPLPKARRMGPYLKQEPEVYPGRSLLGLCRGEQPKDWRGAAYMESYNNITTVRTGYWARSVRTRDWRYSMYPRGEGEQLFDLRNDPHETKNLAADPAYKASRAEMRDRLLEAVILQDYPHTPRALYALGVH
ncbi:MAG TPA: sulfatase-like hydrolase/transferase [Bryobacteraceae bacterium]|nr:sulfatase-like hydrolase/transferase [Bryobacteraceae bacterium]